ncbi:MAG: TPM domain-containing protein [Planctomycetaceae bacterium]
MGFTLRRGLTGAGVALVGCIVWSMAGLTRPAQAVVIDGPRPASAVVDDVGLLDADDSVALERLASGIREAGGGDLAIVITHTTDGQPPRAFATALFNRWQLGSAERNDGLLIFLAMADRKAEIILGDGLDEPRHVAASERIMAEVLIPELRAGRAAIGLRRTVFACASEIFDAGVEDDAAASPIAQPPAPPPPQPWAPPPPQPRVDTLRDRDALNISLLGGGVGGIGVVWFMARRHLRYRIRQCPDCRVDMVRLGETADDAHLSSGQLTEERLASVDYDVWSCPVCPRVTKLRYGAFFTSLASCPTCRFITKSSTVSRIRAPTSWSSGLEQIDERCAHCGYTATSTRIVPQLSDDSSSSHSSCGSSSSSSGGGHSSGSGASGSW